MISKELFIESINELIKADEYKKNLNNFFKNNDVDGYIFQPDCAVAVVNLLSFCMNDEDNIISYFCFELNYGSMESDLYDDNGNIIEINTPEELYDYLINKE